MEQDSGALHSPYTFEKRDVYKFHERDKADFRPPGERESLSRALFSALLITSTPIRGGVAGQFADRNQNDVRDSSEERERKGTDIYPYNTGGSITIFCSAVEPDLSTRASNDGSKKQACYSPLTSRGSRVGEGGKGGPEGGGGGQSAFLHAPAAHARDRFITHHVHLTLANVCFTPVLCPRKHLQHSSSVYLRDTGYTGRPRVARAGKLNTRWAENVAPLSTPSCPYTKSGDSKIRGFVDRKFRASPARLS